MLLKELNPGSCWAFPLKMRPIQCPLPATFRIKSLGQVWFKRGSGQSCKVVTNPLRSEGFHVPISTLHPDEAVAIRFLCGLIRALSTHSVEAWNPLRAPWCDLSGTAIFHTLKHIHKQLPKMQVTMQCVVQTCHRHFFHGEDYSCIL